MKNISSLKLNKCKKPKCQIGTLKTQNIEEKLKTGGENGN